jgi:phage shock protein C
MMTEPIKRLYRTASNRMLGGVCSGLGAYMGLDPTVVRILAVLGLFLSMGTAALVYLALWLLIPEEPTLQPPQA